MYTLSHSYVVYAIFDNFFAARRNIQYPMLFKLTNTTDSKSTHCGVLEFVADEGKAFLPYWVKAV